MVVSALESAGAASVTASARPDYPHAKVSGVQDLIESIA